MAWEFERVAGPYTGPIDGLAWDGAGVLFSVPEEHRILRYDPASGQVSEYRRYTSRTRGIAFDAAGTLYGCQAGSRRIVRFNRDGSATPMEYRLDGHFLNYPDDLAIDRGGRIWFSDPYSRTPSRGPQLQPPLDHASVLQLYQRPDRTWQVRRVTYDTTWPRGVLVSPDQRTLYVANSDHRPGGVRDLRAYPIHPDGTLGQYVVLHTFGADYRGPHRGISGMCLDREGNVVACAGSAASGPGPTVYVFAPSGRVLESHAAPMDQPRNCTFGDADLRTLYVSSADGYLYRVRDTGRQGWLLYPPSS